MDKKAIIAILAVVVVVIAAAAIILSSGGNNDSPKAVESTYYGNGGLTVEGESSVINNVTVTFDEIFLREGYSMKEWNTKADGTGTSYGFYENTKGEKEFYAIWTEDPKSYSLQFNSSSTAGYNTYLDHDGIREKIEPEKTIYCTDPAITVTISFSEPQLVYNLSGQNYERALVKLPDNTEMMVAFKNTHGMSVSVGSTEMVIKTTLNEGKSIFTELVLDKTKCLLDGNGGDLSGVEVMPDVFAGTELSKPGFTRDGYVLKEWNTKIDGSGTSYSLSDKTEAGLILFAQWEKA